MEGKEQKRARLELKHNIMMQRIDKLYSIYSLLNDVSTNGDGSVLVDFLKKLPKHSKTLSIIKEQYNRMYYAIMQTGKFEKYKEVEEAVIPQIAKVELELEAFVYKSSRKVQTVVSCIIESIRQSDNYQNFINLDEELNKLQAIKELLKLYRAYIGISEKQEMERQISTLKFELLYRKQTGEMVYSNRSNYRFLFNEIEETFLKQYSNEKERALFLELIKNKKIMLSDPVDTSKNNKILCEDSTEFLNNTEMLERLIIEDMRQNPMDYINLLNAPLFKPYEFKATKLSDSVEPDDGKQYETNFKEFSISMVKPFIESVIIDKTMSILECEKIYKRFGFECEPETFNRSQKCVRIIWNALKGTEEYKRKFEEQEEPDNERREKGKRYCKFYCDGIRVKKYDELYCSSVENIISLERENLLETLKEIEYCCDRQIEKNTIQMSNWAEAMILPDGENFLNIRVKATSKIQKLEEMKKRFEDKTLDESDVEEILSIIYFIDEALNVLKNNLRNMFFSTRTSPLHVSEEVKKSFENVIKVLEKDIPWVNEFEVGKPKISLYINLDDISDLPVDYDKIEIVYVDEEKDSIGGEKEQEDEER